jgi:hypothetical protein
MKLFSLKIALIVLVSLLVETISLYDGFSVGRISEGQFEYSGLNGWMTPKIATEICKNDPQCGAFTFKVNLLGFKKFEGNKRMNVLGNHDFGQRV